MFTSNSDFPRPAYLVLPQCSSLEHVQVHSSIKMPYRPLWTPSALQCLRKTNTRLQEDCEEGIYRNPQNQQLDKSHPVAVHGYESVYGLRYMKSVLFQLLTWCNLGRVCGITFKPSHIFDRMDYVISPVPKVRVHLRKKF